MQSFNLEMPRTIVFGAGAHARLPELLRGQGNRLLLCTGSGWFARSPWKQRLLELLAGFEVNLLAVPAGEPESDGLEGLLAQARAAAPDLILAVGGGSVLDCAKTLSGLLRLPGRVEDYLEGVGEGRPIARPGVPWVALPPRPAPARRPPKTRWSEPESWVTSAVCAPPICWPPGWWWIRSSAGAARCH